MAGSPIKRRRRILGLELMEERRLMTAVPNPIHAVAAQVASTHRVHAMAGGISLIDNSIGQKIKDYIATLALGNEGRSSLDSIVLDPIARQVIGTGTVVARHSWGRVKNPFTGKSVDVAAQKTFQVRFVYDMATNTIDGTADFGDITVSVQLWKKFEKTVGHLSVDLETLRSVADGELMSLVQLIPNPAPNVLRRENRNSYKDAITSLNKKYGSGNYYLASQKFVDWASPDRLGETLARTLVGDASAIPSLMKKVATMTAAELDGIVAWASKKGVKEAKTIVKDLLAGKKVNSPNLTLSWLAVRYETRLVAMNRQPTPWLAENHGAFVISWRK